MGFLYGSQGKYIKAIEIRSNAMMRMAEIYYRQGALDMAKAILTPANPTLDMFSVRAKRSPAQVWS